MTSWPSIPTAARNLRISGDTWAVLLGADGLLAGGPVGGKRNISRLVGDVLGELDA